MGKVLTKVKYVTFTMLVIFSVSCGVGAIVFANYYSIHLTSLTQTTIRSTVMRWLTWFPLYFFLPCMGFLHGWYNERKQFKETGDVLDESDDSDDDEVVTKERQVVDDSEEYEEDDSSEEEEGCGC